VDMRPLLRRRGGRLRGALLLLPLILVHLDGGSCGAHRVQLDRVVADVGTCKRGRGMELLQAISAYSDSDEDVQHTQEGREIQIVETEDEPLVPAAKKQRLTGDTQPQVLSAVAAAGEEEDVEREGKAAQMPPVEGNADITTSTQRISEQQQVSIDGRVRSFPHVVGIWAGFVYVPLRRIEGIEAAAVRATNMAAAILNKNWKSGQCAGNQPLLHRIPVQDMHLSISRTFALRRPQIDPVVELLRKNLNSLPGFDAAVSGIDLYSNDDKTRSFVGLSLSLGAMRMQMLTRAVDHALTAFSLDPFYEEMRFHVSVAWFAGPLPEGVPTTLVGDDGVVIEAEQGRAGDTSKEREHGGAHKDGGGASVIPRVCFSVQAVEAKIGKKKYSFKLK
jgi:hypothetical protein